MNSKSKASSSGSSSGTSKGISSSTATVPEFQLLATALSIGASSTTATDIPPAFMLLSDGVSVPEGIKVIERSFGKLNTHGKPTQGVISTERLGLRSRVAS